MKSKIPIWSVIIGTFAFMLGSFTFAATISGSTTSPSTLPSGSGDVVAGQVFFTINAATTSDADTAATGSYDIQSFACVTKKGDYDPNCRGPDKNLYPIGQQVGEVQCIKGTTDGNITTVWFSGVVTSIPQDDARTPTEYNALINSLVNSDPTLSHWIFYGRLTDTDGDGIADLRSFFFDQADSAQMNPITSNGTLWSSAYLNAQGVLVGGTLTGANACNAGDALMFSADYKVLNNGDTIQWLNASGHPFGPGVPNTAENLANPPEGVIYELSAAVRDLVNTDTDGIAIAVD